MLSRKEYHRIRGEIALDDAVLDGVEVKRLPSFRDVRCDYCGHSGRARIPFNTKSPRFKCSSCGKRA